MNTNFQPDLLIESLRNFVDEHSLLSRARKAYDKFLSNTLADDKVSEEGARIPWTANDIHFHFKRHELHFGRANGQPPVMRLHFTLLLKNETNSEEVEVGYYQYFANLRGLAVDDVLVIY